MPSRGAIGKSLHLATATLLLFSPLALRAQTTQQAIEARLKDHPLYLRGQWQPNKLKFDLAGNTSTPSITTPFSLCGVDVTRIKLRPDRLEIDGDRVGLEFPADGPKRVSLHTGVEIDIAGSPGADYNSALDKIFADGLADLAPSMPIYWQRYAQAHFTDTAQQTTPTPDARPPRKQQSSKLPVHAPVLMHQVEPAFTPAAKMVGLQGATRVRLIVKEDGSVIRPSIETPLGMGLDEQAVAAVLKYRLKPAMRDDGVPVPVELVIEVNFQIF
jgi:TonB family protein